MTDGRPTWALGELVAARNRAAGAIARDTNAAARNAEAVRAAALEEAARKAQYEFESSRRVTELAAWCGAQGDYIARLAHAANDVSNLRGMTQPWTEPVTSSFGAEHDAGTEIRAGTFSRPLFPSRHGVPDAPSLPALVSLSDFRHLLVATESRATVADDLLRSILLRLVAGSSAGSVRLTLVDPVGGGGGFAIFTTLPPEVRGSRVHARMDEVERALSDLGRHVEDVLQTRLGARYHSLASYNAANPAVAVPQHFLAILGYPGGGWSVRSADLLGPLLRNGPKAGVHVIATVDRSVEIPRGVDVDGLIKAGLLVEIDDQGQGRMDDPDFRDWLFTPDSPPGPERIRELLESVAQGALAPRLLDFASIALPVNWAGSSALEVSVPIGLDEAGDSHALRLSDDPGQDVVAAHGLIGGMTRMGKTNLLHVIIGQLAAAYGPDELRLYLMDFREGVGFTVYEDLPQARVLALESTERDFALSVLHELSAELKSRGDLFRRSATGDKFSAYRAKGNDLPRILVIVDEFQVLFTEDDAVSREASGLLEDLVRRGGGFGIHVLLCSQNPALAGAHLNRLYSQLGLRIALRCREPDALAILGEGNDAAARLETAGVAIYNDQLGRLDENRQLRVAFMPLEAQRDRLAQISALAGGRYPVPITFEGAAPARLERNEQLRRALRGQWSPDVGTADAFLGEPIELKGPTAARFERYPRANLLVAGPDEADAYGLLFAAAFSVLAEQPQSQVHVVDFARPTSPVSAAFSALAERFPGRVEIAGTRDAQGLLDTQLALLAERLGGSADDAPHYLVITGVQRWRELRGEDRFEASPAAAQLLKLLDEGPDLDLHIIAWTDGWNSLERTLKRGVLGHFDLRAALRLPEQDSQNLLESPAASRLADNRAIYRHEEWPAGKFEKFKPYRVPAANALAGMDQS